MRAIIQKVKHAKVVVESKEVSNIDQGLLVFVAVKESDSLEDLEYIKNKIEKLRLFEDENGKMNLSLKQVGASLLVVSQFTLYGDVRKGNRPSFISSAPALKAKQYYDILVNKFIEDGFDVKTGQFQTHMEVSLLNDGPVTIQIDSERLY